MLPIGRYVRAIRIGLRDVLTHHVQRTNPPLDGGIEHLGNPETGDRRRRDDCSVESGRYRGDRVLAYLDGPGCSPRRSSRRLCE